LRDSKLDNQKNDKLKVIFYKLLSLLPIHLLNLLKVNKNNKKLKGKNVQPLSKNATRLTRKKGRPAGLLQYLKAHLPGYSEMTVCLTVWRMGLCILGLERIEAH
jgi:hypothetical protein